MAENKTKITEASVTDFLAGIESDKRRLDGQVILEMMQRISGEPPQMWGPSIIGFGVYHYKYESGREGDMPKISFSPRKAKQVLYVLTNFEGQETLLEKLGKYKTGKICLYINKLEDVDTKILEQIIQACWNQEIPNVK